MKKAIPIVMILLPMLFLLTSCGGGVSQEEYDRVSSDLAAAQVQIQSLQSDLTTAQEQNQSLASDLSAKESELEATKAKMEQAKTAAEIINALFVPILKGEEGEIDPISFLFEWEDKVEATEDAVMEEKFQAVIDSQSGEEELTDFFLYLFENIPKLLE